VKTDQRMDAYTGRAENLDGLKALPQRLPAVPNAGFVEFVEKEQCVFLAQLKKNVQIPAS